MAPSTRSSRGSLSTKESFGTTSIRNNRAKSLPASLARSLVAAPPAVVTSFDFGPATPRNLVLCEACKSPLIKMSPVRASPKTQTSAETPMEKQLEAYILEARARNKLVRAAYASAFRDSRTLGNSDASGKNSPINTYGQSHAPYTVDACAKVGQLMGELGRALDTSNRGLSALEQVLKEEKLWSETEDPVMRLSKEKKWWVKEKEERLAKEDRLEAKKLKKKNRRKKGAK